MSSSSDFREPTVRRPVQRGADQVSTSLWSRIKLVIKRGIFWPYERGSWQYDIIVLIILAFIFLTPAGWFHDRPRLLLSDLRHVQGIVEVGHTGRLWVYQVDARLVDSAGEVPPRMAVQQLLLQRVKPPFVVKSVRPILGKGDVILGYTVQVQR